MEIVLMGRFPHRTLGLFESADDVRIAQAAMHSTETIEFAERRIGTLSGGEAQRVHLAAALAQEPDILLLDEPTASLDLRHQVGVFSLLRRAAAESGLSVVVVTHDLNLASQFCPKVLILHEGKCVAAGPPSEVMTPRILDAVYGVPLALAGSARQPGRQWVVPVLDSGS